MSNLNVVIAFSGSPGSGKTTLASHLATILKCSHASFGAYVRFVASQQGIGHTRPELQELGEQLIEAGVEEFCQACLRHAEWQPDSPLIVDGIRHYDVVVALRKIVSPLPLLWVYITSDQEVRRHRLELRDGDDTRTADLHQVVMHSTEIQVETTLSQLADLVVDGQQSIDALGKEIVIWAHSHDLSNS